MLMVSGRFAFTPLANCLCYLVSRGSLPVKARTGDAGAEFDSEKSYRPDRKDPARIGICAVPTQIGSFGVLPRRPEVLVASSEHLR